MQSSGDEFSLLIFRLTLCCAIATAFAVGVDLILLPQMMESSDTTDDVLASTFDAHFRWQTKSTDSWGISQSHFGFGEFVVDA